jgi:hypothetical protein
LIALLGVSLFILGCDDSSDDAPGLTPEEKAEALAEKTVFKDKVTVKDATVTVNAGTAITISEAFTVEDGVTLVVPATATLTVPAGKPATINGTLIIGDGADKVTVTKATLKGGVAAGAGTLTLADGDELTLSSSGTIVVATTGTGGVILPNTEFGAGTYTATGTIAIKAVTTGDTITTGAVDKNDKLTIGTLALGEASTVATEQVTYTLTKSTSAKVALTTNTLTIPAGASVAASAKAGITLGSIVIGRASTTGNGHLDLAAGSEIGTFTGGANASSGVKIAAAVNLADGDNTGAKAVDVGTNSNGVLTVAAGGVKLYGANGASDNATIAAGVDLDT